MFGALAGSRQGAERPAGTSVAWESYAKRPANARRGRRPIPVAGRSESQANSGKTIVLKETRMTLHIALEPLLALAAGILILVMPKLLNYVVAGYLILIGLAGLLNL